MININKNYEDKMNIDNGNSTKNYSYEKVKNLLTIWKQNQILLLKL